MCDRCNLCGRANPQFLFNIEGAAIVRCRSCGLVYRSPQPDPEEELEIYRGAPLVKESNIDFIKKREILLKYLLGELNRHAQKGKLLDLGCQFGYFLQLARKDGWQTFGVDVSKRATVFAREKLKLNVFTGTLKEANFPDEFFDAVSLWEVLNHMSRPMQELKEVWRILKKGGAISFRLQNLNFHLRAHYLYQFFAELLKIFKIGDISIFHLYGFSPKIIKRMLKDSGFRDIEVKNSMLSRGDLYNFFIHLNSTIVTVSKNIFSFLSSLLFFLSARKIVLSPSMIVHARK